MVLAERVYPQRRKQIHSTTRRGKQFNSMVQAERHPLTGAHRQDVFMSAEDAQTHALKNGDHIILHNEVGTLHGRVKIVPMRPGNLQVY